MKILLSILILTLALGCSNSDKILVNPENIETYTIDLNDAQKGVKFSDLIENYQIIQLESTEGSLIGKINKVLFTTDYIFVLDRFNTESIFQFDSKGKFIRKVGSNGLGPKEYSKPLDFIIYDDKISILDNGVGIVTYSHEGDFVKKSKLREASGFYFDKLEGGWTFVGGARNDNIIITNDDFDIKKGYFPWMSRSTDVVIINALFKDTEGNVMYRRRYKDTVYQVNKNGISPRIAFNYQSKQFDLGQVSSKTADRFINRDIHKYYVTSRVYLADNTTYVVIDYDADRFIFIANGNRDQLVIYKESELINDLTYEYNSSYTLGAVGDKILYALEPEKLKEGVSIAIKNGDLVQEEVMKVYSTIEDNENPLLLLVQFKNDM